ncbi:carbohydrate ABC transporter permease [Streptomyces sp. NPDC056255]|uniref:carbohydrate ABC transporter permease n=1 Tax=Streptomyces sp. NPDC056255 TaxID=3345764 RepID=UPI0035DB975B
MSLAAIRRGEAQRRSRIGAAGTTRSGVIHTYRYAFLVPAVTVFTVFFLLPAFFGMYLSLTDASTYVPDTHFVGLANYRLMAGDSSVLWNATWNQFLYAACVTVGKTGLGVAIAFLLNRTFTGAKVLRVVVYLPIMFSTIVVGLLFGYILKADGPLNTLLTPFGLDQNWLGSFDLALYSVTAVDTWMGVGWTVVLVLAALQAVPQELIESAHLDGAGAWQTARHIKVPYIRHAINLAALLTFITGMKAFDMIYATTGGGPGTATEVLTSYVYKQLNTGALGYASAVNVVQFLLITSVALVINRFVRKMEAAA